jgi:hypothetical protein
MAALHPHERTYDWDPLLEAEDATPDFLIPVYPAYLTLAAEGRPFELKPELQVTQDAPPICLIHAHDDVGETCASGSALLYLAYKKLNIPAELHIYAKGGHGFGTNSNGVPIDDWFSRVIEWMHAMGWIRQPTR